MCSHLVTSSVDLSIPYNGLRKKADFQATNIHDAGWMFGPPVQMFLGWKSEAEGITPEEAKSSLTKNMALQDMASDADVAEAIVFIASDRAKGITGQTLFVNAGEFMH